MTRYLIVLAIIWTLGGCFFSPDPDGGLTDLGAPRDMGLTDLGAPRDGSVNPDLALACGPGSCPGCCEGTTCRTMTSSASCGIGGQSCKQCEPNVEVCLPNGICGLDRNEIWKLIVDTAIISPTNSKGGSWDLMGGLPDPYVTIGQNSTQHLQDMLEPSWNDSFPFTLNDLLNGVNVSVWDDDDPFKPDSIAGPKKLTVTTANLIDGKIEWSNWNSVKSITFKLSK